MVLIAALKQAGVQILVSHCSSDMILAKAVGANHAATGKFFNLRRFTKGRFKEPGEKGGEQFPTGLSKAYWRFFVRLTFSAFDEVALRL